ncbi:pilus assembly protein TadG-related protein [Angustibacter sp. McL0619]|uniref:pilus assembly protein TadG-related protein n=1 Tax=Angustibacter sp. McL0619 TaxID=3415676 RepID=UPI003CF40019
MNGRPRSAWSPRRPKAGSDDGQISLLILGYLVLAFALVTVVVDAASVHLAHTQLIDAADAAALDAADALAEPDVYGGGLPDARAVPLTDLAVHRQAALYLSAYPPPRRLEDVALASGTGTSDGASATVALTGRVRLPIAGFVVVGFTGGVSVHASSTARAQLDR